MQQMTGERLFLLYAFPCSACKLAAKKIDMKRFDLLKGYVDSGKETGMREVLKRTFRKAFLAMRELAQESGDQPWSLENVSAYWHSNHGHSGSCAVSRIRLGENFSLIRNVVLVGTKTYLNNYGLEILPGKTLYIHADTIVEALDE